jgi:hypothetical protein
MASLFPHGKGINPPIIPPLYIFRASEPAYFVVGRSVNPIPAMGAVQQNPDDSPSAGSAGSCFFAETALSRAAWATLSGFEQERFTVIRTLSFELLAGGIVLIVLGTNASNTLSSDISRFFTGSPYEHSGA